MAFISQHVLENMGFKHLGKDVKISDKASIYNPELISIGDHSRIDDFCVISGNVTLGKYVHIAIFCNIAGGTPGIELEDFSGFAYGCYAFAQSDDYSGRSMTNPTVPKKFKAEICKSIKIGRHAIIGAQSIIMPGADIAEGCSVGAMSLISKPTQPWGIYFGIPAKRIKNRSQDLLALEKEFFENE